MRVPNRTWRIPFLLMALLMLVGTAAPVPARIVFDPKEFSANKTRLDFDDLSSVTGVTTRYLGEGVTFSLENGTPERGDR